MGLIMINCPATGQGISTGIEVVGTDQIPIVTATTVCPECGRTHQWTKNDVWLASGGEQYRGEQSRNLASLLAAGGNERRLGRWRIVSGGG